MANPFEDFIKADEDFKYTKEEIRSSLRDLMDQKTDASMVRPDRIQFLRRKLEDASARLIVTAGELSRSEALETQEAASKCARIEIELGNRLGTQNKFESESVNQELKFVEQLTENVRFLLREKSELSVKLSDMTQRSDSLRIEVASMKSSIVATENLNQKTRSHQLAIDEKFGRLLEIRNEIKEQQSIYESTRIERESSLLEESQLELSIAQKRALKEKLNDQLFLIELDAKKDKESHALTLLKRETIQSELEELKQFPVPEIENRFSDAHIRAEILTTLEAECQRLSVEIDRIRESQFRARVKY